MSAPHNPRRKGGPKPLFSFDDVRNVALELGIDAFSLTAIARHLGVKAPSIYRVVESREQLAYSCVQHAINAMQLPDPELSWDQQLHYFADELWRVCRTFRGLAQTIVTNPHTHLAVRDYMEALLEQLSIANSDIPLPRYQFGIDLIGKITVMSSVVEDGMTEGATAAATKQELVDHDYLALMFPHLAEDNNAQLRAEQIGFVIAGLGVLDYPRDLAQRGMTAPRSRTAQ